MCFGGGGGQQQSAPPQINVMPAPMNIKPPEPPKSLENTYKPIATPDYLPGIQQSGTAQRRRDQLQGRSDTRRRKLSTGALNLGRSNSPSGGINL